MDKELKWFKVLDHVDELPEGRVTTVTAQHMDFCLTHHKGKFTAMDNKCPHKGGPLGEGSIEKGILRCPWHGWDFCPHGGSIGEFDDGLEAFPLKVEDDAVFIGLEIEPPHEPTITDVMAETMVNWGVNRVFGMVGHSNLGMADALRRQEEKGNLKFIGIRHEGAASFAASAYGKLTGKPAACFAIAGPGSTNMYTGLWDAKVDRSPLLALSGQVATQVVGTGNFQEVDLVRAFESVAEFNQRVEAQSEHAELMTLAIKHAILKRDVSHLTFPDQIQVQPANGAEAQTAEKRITSSLKIAPPKDQLEAAIEKIKEAKRPIIVTGHGARFHMDEIVKLGERLNCPMITTFKGKGQVSDFHPLGCGVIGRSGTPVSTYFMNEADLIIVIGASFSRHTGLEPKIPTIQIDFDPLAIAKFHKIEVGVYGEISRTMELINEAKGLEENKFNAREEIAERWSIWRAEKHSRLMDDRMKGASSITVFDALTRLSPENAIMCVDVGNNAYSFGRYFESKKHTFLMSGYLGSIGFALPASIGAWAAVENERPIIAVAGDGGVMQYLAEFTTLVRYNMPVKLIIINNNELAKISKEQRSGGWDKWATDLVNPNFAAYAESCGGLGIQVSMNHEVEEAMKQLLAHDGPALLEVKADGRLL